MDIKTSFQCEFCEKSYAYQKNLNLHLKKAHGLEKGIASFPFDAHTHKCLEGCNRSFRLISDLRYHLKQDHGKIMEAELLAFRSMRDFKMWFDNLVKQNNVTYFREVPPKTVFILCVIEVVYQE
ncbi:hypothetical protein HHI36_020582 [Cryptolaemus montrouzieri]|uniref:C2H2-type domain-containing protein n=1 Tax=Cryptolaemus montrouzieri TaxID=559131 RepID=A0ABD2NBS1_9CUCU